MKNYAKNSETFYEVHTMKNVSNNLSKIYQGLNEGNTFLVTIFSSIDFFHLRKKFQNKFYQI